MMKYWGNALFNLGIIALFVMAGCSKKVTKTPVISQESTTTEYESSPSESKAVDAQEMKVSERRLVKVDLIFADVNFDYDKSELRADARELLVEHARKLKENPDVRILIEGHCDERGTIEYNLALGDRRANSVRSYLVNYGIAGKRLSTISYGKERPLDSRSTPDAWAKNRRGSFVIIQQ